VPAKDNFSWAQGAAGSNPVPPTKQIDDLAIRGKEANPPVAGLQGRSPLGLRAPVDGYLWGQRTDELETLAR